MQRFLVFLSILFVVLSDRAFGDEGMWLFNNPPLKQLKEKYNFEPTPQWLEHLQKSSVRFNSGGSGSFVSSTGLCITNHHVGLDTLQKISSEKNNYVRDGFYAKSQKDETKATIRNIPMQSKAEEGKCIKCGGRSERRVIFARAY